MLLLSRKEGQKIIVGDNIEIVVVEVRGSAVRIGVKAPASVLVLREELVNRKKDDCENRSVPNQEPS